MAVLFTRAALFTLLISTTAAFTVSPNNHVTRTSSSTSTATRHLSFVNKRNSNLHMSSEEFDFDVAIIGCGVGGHGAALHSRAQQLKTAVFSGNDVGGTCVNRGCVPSKALLAASGRVREMKDVDHLASLGIEVKEADGDEPAIGYSREGIAAHAKNLANRVKGNLEASLVGLGVDVVEGRGVLTGKPHEVMDESTGKVYRAKVGHGIYCMCSNYL